MQTSGYGIHWFRRDLRVAGNPALKHNWKLNKGRVVGVFCFDKVFLSRPDFSFNRFQFFIETLIELRKELRNIGSDLLVLDEGPVLGFQRLFEILRTNKKKQPHLVTWNRDYEPFARARDEKMEDFFRGHSIEFKTFRDHLLIEPEELTKADGHGYQIYTPFAKRWMELIEKPDFFNRYENKKMGFEYLERAIKGDTEKLFNLTWREVLNGKFVFQDTLEVYRKNNTKFVNIKIPPAGSLEAYKSLKGYAESLEDYGANRDFPAHSATSRFSIYLKNGSLTSAQILAFYQLRPYKKKLSSRDIFLSELVWREFYYHILYRHPYVEKGCFIKKYDNLNWQNNTDFFEKWKRGETGFPIVDAGMRELMQTGWMHNRVRMIVASFLTKSLLIDWRWGEKYFMEKLLDGDLASNNGGWQWAASTGCDSQPYFRVFNPWLQSQKFDSEGEYIFKFLPELKGRVQAKDLHQPCVQGYFTPIVNHKGQKTKAIKMYTSV